MRSSKYESVEHMQETMRDEYRASCDLRRSGKKIGRREANGWVLEKEYKTINEAKRAMRGKRSYTV